MLAWLTNLAFAGGTAAVVQEFLLIGNEQDLTPVVVARDLTPSLLVDDLTPVVVVRDMS